MRSIIKSLLLATAANLAISGAGLTADLSRALPPRPAVWSWTGLYAGVNGGYGWDWTTDAVVVGSSIGLRTEPSGALFGGQVGYNWQWAPEWVVGVETDLDWANVFGSQTGSAFGLVFADPFAVGAQRRLTALGTLRGRVGYALEDVLLYGTGGIAYGGTTLDTGVTDLVACGPTGFCAAASSTQWMVGWAAGVGFDWAFLPRWTFRTEYLHYDLGSHQENLMDPAVPGVVINSSATFRGDIVRGAINFKFN